MQLYPGEDFIILRQVEDPIDTNTYYVRAVVRNAKTDALLETLDLTDNGDQRFTKLYEVPIFSGLANNFISITTKVYTDSGYSVLADSQAITERTYLVEPRIRQVDIPIGGPDFNYKKIKEIVREELKARKFPEQREIKIPTPKEYDHKFSEIIKTFAEIRKLLTAIPTKIVNLEPIVLGISELVREVKEVKGKPVTPETNLRPVLEMISEAKESRESNLGEIRALLTTLEKTLTGTMRDTVPEIMKGSSFSIPMNMNSQEKSPATDRSFKRSRNFTRSRLFKK